MNKYYDYDCVFSDSGYIMKLISTNEGVSHVFTLEEAFNPGSAQTPHTVRLNQEDTFKQLKKRILRSVHTHSTSSGKIDPIETC